MPPTYGFGTFYLPKNGQRALAGLTMVSSEQDHGSSNTELKLYCELLLFWNSDDSELKHEGPIHSACASESSLFYNKDDSEKQYKLSVDGVIVIIPPMQGCSQCNK